MARIQELVKTYKLINDPNAPHWSIRFVGGIAIVALLVAGAAAVFWTGTHSGPGPTPNALLVSTTENTDGTRTDQIHLANFDAALAPDYDALDAELARWHAQHPGVQVLSQTEIKDAARLHTVGYEIRYR